MVPREPGDRQCGFTEEGVVIMSRAADGSNRTRTYGPVLNGWSLGSQGLSGLEQDWFTSLSGVKRE